jgi:predicted NBD/HSP70 family sugar kinase
MDAVLAIDIGGTNTRLLVAEARTNKELARHTIPTQPRDYWQTLADIATYADTFDHRVLAVAAGIAGVFESGIMVGSGNLFDWRERSVQTDLQNILCLPVVVMNDAEAAALGEYTEFMREFAYVCWGTGIGGALVFTHEGKPYVRATELGHLIIDRKSRLRCGCGGYGHFEALVGGQNIPNRYFGDKRGIHPQFLTNAQWGKVLGDMAIGLRSISAIAPGLPIVLGGGIMTKQSFRLPQLQALVNELRSSSPSPELLLAKLGEDSGLAGARFAAQRLCL